MTNQGRQPGRTKAWIATLRTDHAWHWAALCAALLLVGGAVAFLAMKTTIPEISAEAFQEAMLAAGPWGLALVVLLMVVHSFVPFPAEFIAIAAGACFGFWVGTAAVWVGAMLGASVSFFLARTLGRPFVNLVLAKRHRQALDRWSHDQGALTLLLSRFIPIIAFNLINYAAGLTTVGWWTFLWTTAVGILPITALSVFVGVSMQELPLPWLITLSVAGVGLIAALHWLARKKGWLTGLPKT